MIKIHTIPEKELGSKLVYWKDPVITIDAISYDLSLLPVGASAHLPDCKLRNVERFNDYYCIYVSVDFNKGKNLEKKPKPEEINVTSDGVVIEIITEEESDELAR